MKHHLSLIIYTLLVLVPYISNAQNELLKLEDIWASNQFSSSGISEVRSMKNGLFYTDLVSSGSSQFIVKNDFKTGTTIDTLFSSDYLRKNNINSTISDYIFSNDESKIILTTEKEPIYRHSTKSTNYIYDIVTKKIQPLSLNGKQQYATFSPDGEWIAFVRENNIYLTNIKDNTEKAVTTDGKRNEIIYGAADWVYEEEFSFQKAFQWSPDGKHIGYYRFDESNVKEFNLTYYEDLYPKEEKYKYPMPGEENSKVEIYIYNIQSGKAVKTDVNKETDQYIPRIAWTADANKLCVMRLNRMQNKLELYSCDATTGRSALFFTEENKAYIEIGDDLTFLDNKKEFIWTSTIDGYNHIYLYDMTGKLKKQITSGKWDVTNFYGYDAATGNFFYQAASKNSMEKQVFATTKKGQNRELSVNSGTNTAIFSTSFKYYFITNSGLNRPHKVSLFNWTGNLVRVVKENKTVISAMAKFKLTKPEFFNFTTTEGISLNGWIIKPAGFEATKKYPVIQYMYGGPNSQTVKDEWLGPNYFWFQMLAQKGYIIVSVDNRGTGCRGEEFNKCIYKHLGKYETIDQIEVAKWLGKQTYVDASRIGAWGWSFGGYMSSLLITIGADYFKTAIAVAPVTNWKFYDSIYTERYLQTPQLNGAGYDEYAPVNFAKLLKGNFMLIHGSVDDNVHLQNTMELVSSLVKANKQFTSFIYPNKAHGISGARLHLYTQMTNFFLEKL